jgi:hypothetical protein
MSRTCTAVRPLPLKGAMAGSEHYSRRQDHHGNPNDWLPFTAYLLSLLKMEA